VDVQEAYAPFVEAFLRAVQAASTEDVDAAQHSFLKTLLQIVLSDEAGHHHQLETLAETYSTLCGKPAPPQNVIEDRVRRWDAWHLYRELADRVSPDERTSDEEQPQRAKKRRRGTRGGRGRWR